MTKEEAIKYLQELYPNGGHCWLDEQRIEAISMAIKVLQEEPVSNAIEREVKVDVCGYPYIDFTELYDYDNDMPLAKEGDKVKLVILGENNR